MATLEDMVYMAKEAGADFAKVQTFFADDLSDNWRKEMVTDYDRLKKLELTFEQQSKFVNMCESVGLMPMTSIYSDKYIEQLKQCGFGYIKIGSAQCQNSSLINRVILAGFEVVVSTGGYKLVDLDLQPGAFAYLHCVSKYPTRFIHADMYRMLHLRDKFAGNFGLSCHIDPASSRWDLPGKFAIYSDANIIEKHVTSLPRDKTKDGPVSLTFPQLKELCDFRDLEKDEVLSTYPYFGFFYYEKTPDEVQLIDKYSYRWGK